MGSLILEKEIRKRCALTSTFQKGSEIFQNDGVFCLDMAKASEKSVNFLAVVEGSGGREYNVELELGRGEEYTVKDFYCSCPAYESYGGFCKHLAAVALEINYRLQEEDVDNFLEEEELGAEQDVIGDWDEEEDPEDSMEWFFKDFHAFLQKQEQKDVITSSGRTFYESPAKSMAISSQELLDAMSEVTLKERNQFCQEITAGDVELEVTLRIEPAAEIIELRIGKSRMYVVKSIMSLAEHIRKQDYVYYGKSLDFVHTQSAFSKNALPIVALLLEWQEEYSYSNQRYQTLNPQMLDEVMELFEGKLLNVDDQRADQKKLVPVCRKDPRLPLSIKGENAGKLVKIKFPEIILLEGARQLYIYWEDCIYICSEDYCREMQAAIKLMYVNKSRSDRKKMGYFSYCAFQRQRVMELCERDYASFCATLLPIFEKYMEVQEEGVDFTAYQMEEGVYKIYFDVQGRDTIVCRAEGIYGEKEHNLMHPAAVSETYRDVRTEYEIRTLLNAYLPERTGDGEQFLLKQDDDKLAALIEDGMAQLGEMAEVFASEAFKRIRIAGKVQVATGLSVKGNLLEVSWDVEGMSKDELTDILSAYKRKKKFFRLKNGELLRLGESGLEVLADMQEDLHLTKEQLKAGTAQLPIYRSLYLNALMKDNSQKLAVSTDEVFEHLIEQFDEIKERKYELPEGVIADFRPYQMEGYRWGCALMELGFGGILADDMGLGKTLQMIACMRYVKGEPHLVVCPASLVYNWEAEFQKFAPEMKVCPVAGTAAQRQELIKSYQEYDVLITSYDLLKRDVEMYVGKTFSCQIIDEAQYIKNPGTQAAKAVKSIASRNRFALTGTPIENRLSELWSIFEYLMPGYLHSYKYFKEHYEEHIVQGAGEKEQRALHRLHIMIRPFLLRRLKKDVLKDLPDKLEEVVYSKFEAEQQKLYQATEKKMVDSLKKQSAEEFKENKLQILAELTRLRQICCDPALLYENYSGGAAKLETCLELVETAISGGHKILLFSQFTSMLEILKERLKQQKLRVFLFTGSTSKQKRRDLVARFQAGEGDVFLISLKAGGTGLNLTAADIVIHYDPWWNVAAQNQATDRAHRIGQEQKVTVMKLIAKGTIEERILKLQEQKQMLADKIISGEGMAFSSFTKEELLELFGG